MKRKKRIALIMAFALSSLLAYGGNYSLKVGESKTIYCTATAPAGYITHAYFSLVNPADAQCLAISYRAEDCCATFVGLSGKSNIQVEVTYAYSYEGSYDHRMHVGHGSYYDYISVSGAGLPTDITVDPLNATVNAGESVTVSAVFTPQNAYSACTWGIVYSMSGPGFDIQPNGTKAVVTTPKGRAATGYFVLETANGLYRIFTVTTVKSDVKPTAVTIREEKVELEEGSTATLHAELTPEYAEAEMSWTSSNEGVVSVTKNGKVSAVAAGTATVSVETDNGLSAKVSVKVYPKATSLMLPANVTIYHGYTSVLSPRVSPSGAKPKLKWSTSDSSIATVSGGQVRAVSPGTTVITVSGGDGCSASCNVTVEKPEPNLEARAMHGRLNAVKGFVNEVLNGNMQNKDEKDN